MGKKKQGNSLLANAFILSLAAIISKGIGAVYQIFISNMIGTSGAGLYTKGINVYAMLLAISASGIPIAVSKLMAEELARDNLSIAKKIFRVSLALLSLLGIVLSALLYFLAPVIATNMLGDPRLVQVLQSLAPALLVVTIMGVYRGYFQGKQNMVPTAFSQIVEQIARVGFSVVITLAIVSSVGSIAPDSNVVLDVVNGIAFGPLVGAIMGILVCFWYYFKDKKDGDQYKPQRVSEVGGRRRSRREKSSYGALVVRIVAIAFPVTVAALLPTLIDVSDASIITATLTSAGLDQVAIDQLYGFFSVATLMIINLITLIASSFAISLVPSISAGQSRGDSVGVQEKSSLSIKLVTLISLPAMALLFLLGEPVLTLIFGTGDANYVLTASLFLILFMGLYHATTGILQGLGKTYIPIISLLIGLLVNVGLLTLLVGRPSLSFILGAPIAHTVAYGLALLINFIGVKKAININLNLKKWFPQTVIISLVSGLVAFGLYRGVTYLCGFFLGGRILAFVGLVVGALIALFIYLLLLVKFKALREEEARMIPKIGNVIVKISAKFERK